MYRVAVCDDCAADGQHIRELVEQIFRERGMPAMVALFGNPAELLSDIETNHNQYDLYLLDVLMGETNGIELAETLRGGGSRAMLIYITSSRDYAIYGYKVQANDYLLKPIEKAALDASIRRILARRETVLVESDGAMKSLPLSDIRYAEAYGHYVLLQTTIPGETARLRATLSEVQQKLGDERFARCHKGYIVNLAHVREIRLGSILLHGGDTIPLGRRYRCELQKDMVEYVEKAVPL